MVELVCPVKNKSNTIDVEVETTFFWNLIWVLGKIINDSKKVISRIKLAIDLNEHYLEQYILNTGQSTSGFLVLPVKKGTPLKISL